MQSIYPGDTRDALEVFCLYEAEGEYFDISDLSHVTRDSIGIAPFTLSVGPAVEAAQVVEMGIAQVKQLGSRQSRPAAGAAINQNSCLLVRQNLRQVRILNVIQRQQLRPAACSRAYSSSVRTSSRTLPG